MACPSIFVTASVSPSTSLSLAITSMTTVWFSSTAAVSSTALGASFVPWMVTVTSTLSVPPWPSFTVTV